ncbi:MAG: hypothetical protein DMD89_36590 [Candidatus Rokuibacteriota bacterium]|nr:MAG: hypothetical protein DMD89_36590 [Candidatus Rokubacteria bacterium]
MASKAARFLGRDMQWADPEPGPPRLFRGTDSVGQEGRTGLLGCAATTNQACFAVLPNPVEFDSAFLQLWFRHKYQELRDLTEGRGGSQPNLNGEILRTLEVPLPALPEQLRVVRDTEAGLGHVVTVRRVVKEQMDSIAALPAALLRQAFRGEL